MKLLGGRKETRHSHQVYIDLADVQVMRTREGVYFSPHCIVITYERMGGYPTALTSVTIEGPVIGNVRNGRRPPIMLKYAALMHGTDTKLWATKTHWKSRFRNLPSWAQHLVEENWPGPDIF